MNQAKTQTHNKRLSSKATTYEALGVKNSSRIKDDHKAEELLAAGISTPLGRLLGKISKLPEVRLEKVFSVRRQICKGQYGLDDKFDTAIDSMLEDLLICP